MNFHGTSFNSRFYNRGKWLRSVASGRYGYLPHGDSAFGYYVRPVRTQKKLTRAERRNLALTCSRLDQGIIALDAMTAELNRLNALRRG